MKIDFFADNPKHETIDDELFGIVDDELEPPQPVRIDRERSSSRTWNCTVANPAEKTIDFYPVDHCLDLRREDGSQEKCCDALLAETGGGQLFFLELKNRRKSADAVDDAIEQLANTIRIFQQNHNLPFWKKTVAYAANRKHPSFNFSRKDEMLKFRQEHHVRLVISARIEIF
ncbi:MAG: hypothetical protein IKO93_03325 [Lentisphaeria bacterium]|nr:hypothetical protein [Lentisphaeria bacterium]